MKTYRVYGNFYGSKFLGEFSAETKQAAIEQGLESEANCVCLCHQCSDEIELNDFSAQEGSAEEVN